MNNKNNNKKKQSKASSQDVLEIDLTKVKSQKKENNLQVLEIDLNKIIATYNPRQTFDEIKIAELAESIKKVGVIQPITIRTAKDKEGMFEIICGERRYRASKLAKKRTIPAYIRECTDEERIDIAFIENIEREDINDIEIADAIKLLIDNEKEDFNSMAVRLGKSVKYVRDRYQLNNLIDEFKSMVINNSISLGKAIFISSYNKEIQEDIHSKHFDESTDWNYWGGYSLTKLINRIDSSYNCNLKRAEFDKTQCETCCSNSAVSDLFPNESDDVRCLNRECFNKKHQLYKLQKAEALIEENPTYLITKSYASDWFVKELQDKGFEIVDVKFHSMPCKPDEPEAPNKEDFLDEETGEFGESEFQTAEEDYKEELDAYQSDLKEYEDDIKEFEQGIEQNKIEPCFVIRGEEISVYYRTLSDSESQIYTSDDEDNPNETASFNVTEKAQIAKLSDKDNRNKEIKVEKIIQDIKSDVVVKGKDLSAKEGVKLEQDILFYYLLSETSRANKMKFFGEEYPDGKKKYEFVSNLSAENRTAIIRDYIIAKMRSYASSSSSIDSQLFIEFSKLHFPKETLDIEMKHQEVYEKRRKSIDAKIGDIKKVSKVEIPEEPEVEKIKELD